MSLGAFENPLAVFGPIDPLVEIWRAVQRLGSTGPGYLWISRSASLGRYPQNLFIIPNPVVIPGNVTVAFAPGARLTLDTDFVLEIAGPLDAGVEPRFVLGMGARVLLTGPLDEIRAAWWEDENPGGYPVLRALDALWYRYQRSLDPAPIVLGGPYQLDDTVRIAPPPDLRGTYEVVLRGVHYAPRDRPTFKVLDHDSVGSVHALLAVDGGVVLTMEHLGFDLRRPSGRPPPAVGLTLAGEHDRSRIDACHFELGGGTGVHLTVFGQAWRDTFGEDGGGPDWLAGGAGLLGLAGGGGLVWFFALVAEVGGAGRRAARVDVSRCIFVGSGGSAVPIDVDVTAPTTLRVTDSQFSGLYDRGIAFVGAELTVTACTFDNTARPVDEDPFHGTDIHLGTRAPLPVELSSLAAANPSLTMTHCLSTSPILLRARPAFTGAGARDGGMVLTNVVHRPAAQDTHHSVYCGTTYPARSLILQGCEFGANVEAWGPDTGIIVDLGSRFEPPEAGASFVGRDHRVVVSMDPESAT